MRWSHSVEFCSLSVMAALAWTTGCGDDSADGDGATGGGGGGAGGQGTGGVVDATPLDVSGTVVDFSTGDPVSGAATVSVTGLNPLPTVSVTGADFTIEDVPPFSVFHVLGGLPPSYRATYNTATEVTDQDVEGVLAPVVSESFVDLMETTFGSPSSGGIVVVRVLSATGTPLAGVSGADLTVNGEPPLDGPHFLDEDLQPVAGLIETSTSGYVVFFDVPDGLVSIGAVTGSGITVTAAAAPVAANAVTLVNANVTDGNPVLPTDVSFANQVVPIFTKRGCIACHSGNSIGADLGDLALNGGDNKVHKELTEEVSPTYQTRRVDLEVPANSLVLKMPSAENPPDAHPNVTFSSPQDPDYLLLLAWITEGAKLN